MILVSRTWKVSGLLRISQSYVFHHLCDLNKSGVSSWCNGYSNGLRDRRTRFRTPVALLRSLLGKYPWERYEPPYPPSYGLNSTTTVLLGEWLWH